MSIESSVCSLNIFNKEYGDKDYMAFKAEVWAWHKEAKLYWSQLAEKYQSYLDKDFVNKFPDECVSRLWELTLVHYIASQGEDLKLINFPIRKNESKPDFFLSRPSILC